jgi:aldehyde dehydrogenase (NAD+)
LAAPNHIFVPEEAVDGLVAAFKEAYASFYPEGPQKSESYGRIISDVAFNRLKSLIDETKGDIILGGHYDASTRFIAPTIVSNVKLDDVLMKK